MSPRKSQCTFRRLALLGLVLGAFLGGCRKPGTKISETRSIDAILTGDETQRQNLHCGKEGVEANTPEGAVDQVFGQVPKRFRDEFPDLRRHIKLASAGKVFETCKAVFEQQASQLFKDRNEASRALARLKNLGSCWTLSLEGDVPDAPVPTIHVARDVGSVHNNLLAMLTYSLIELYADKAGDAFERLPAAEQRRLVAKLNAGKAPIESGDVLQFIKEIKSMRKRLAVAVVADLKALGKHDVLAEYRRRYLVQTDAALAKSRFAQNMFFAESVESYYCSAESRRLFVIRGMTNTWQAIQEVGAYLDR